MTGFGLRASGFGLTIACVLVPHVVAAEPAPLPCTFLEIGATNGDKASIDADLRPLEKKLKRPPFSAWNVFRMQSRNDTELIRSKPETLTLKIGKATVMLRDHSEKRVMLEISVDDAAGKRIIAMKPDIPDGDWLVLGTNSNNDGHLLALTCK